MGRTILIAFCLLAQSVQAISHCGAQYPKLAPLTGGRTLGIEVEATIPKTVSAVDLQNQLADTLRAIDGITNVRTSRELPGKSLVKRVDAYLSTRLGFDTRDYVITYERDGREYRFSFGSDASIEPPVGRRGIEIRSPVLHTQADLQAFVKILEKLKENGMEAAPRSGGVHIHVGAADLGPEQLGNLVESYAKAEHGLLDFFFSHDRRAKHIQPITEALKEGAVLKLPIAELMKRSADRNRTLNLLTLKKFGTVEFRLFNSTVDIEHLMILSDFCAKFVDAAATRPEDLKRVLNGREPIDALPELMRFLEVPMPRDGQELTRRLLLEVAHAVEQRYPLLSPLTQLRARAFGSVMAIGILGIIADDLLLPNDESAKQKPSPTPTPTPTPR